MKTAQDVLDLWFPPDNGFTETPELFRDWVGERMYGGMDAVICSDYVDLTTAAARGECDDWANTARGTLALLLGLTAVPALAYVGPGLGAGTLGVILGLVGSLLLALVAFFWYPLKRAVLGKSADKDAEENLDSIELADMTGIARTIVAETYAPYEIFISMAIIYMAFTWVLQKSFGRIERYLGRYAQREA